jgi:hypothetical protein
MLSLLEAFPRPDLHYAPGRHVWSVARDIVLTWKMHCTRALFVLLEYSSLKQIDMAQPSVAFQVLRAVLWEHTCDIYWFEDRLEAEDGIVPCIESLSLAVGSLAINIIFNIIL